jgi:hypothetical protein
MMNLDFKGIISKDALEKDINNLDGIIRENNYAIIVENGIGKYVVFDIDYVRNSLELKGESFIKNRQENSPFTLVESMIQTLEELPKKKTTAILLSSLVEKYYGKAVSPVIIRTRAEENANNQGEVDYFFIEPGNVIGLSENSSFDLYMYNKMKRTVDYELNKLFKNDDYVELNKALYKINSVLGSSLYQKYTKDFSNKDIINMIKSLNRYIIDNNYIRHA